MALHLRPRLLLSALGARASRWRALAALLFVCAAPAWACPVCGQTSPESQNAYLAMTAMMTLLPLSLIGGVVLWVRAKLKRGGDEGQPR